MSEESEGVEEEAIEASEEEEENENGGTVSIQDLEAFVRKTEFGTTCSRINCPSSKRRSCWKRGEQSQSRGEKRKRRVRKEKRVAVKGEKS